MDTLNRIGLKRKSELIASYRTMPSWHWIAEGGTAMVPDIGAVRVPVAKASKPLRRSYPMFDRNSTALASFLALALVGLSGHLANAASPLPAQANTSAQAQADAQTNRRELSLMLTQDQAAKNPWAVTNASGVNIQSRAGFVGYH
jgi:hypothetical protein